MALSPLSGDPCTQWHGVVLKNALGGSEAPPRVRQETHHLVAWPNTYSATSSMSSGPNFSPNAGMEPLPLVTWVLMAAMLKPPVRYFSRASFFNFFSGDTLLLPPAWQDVQLPWKTLSPFSRSAARAGRPAATAARSPRAAPNASGLQAEAWGAASRAVCCCCNCATAALASGVDR